MALAAAWNMGDVHRFVHRTALSGSGPFPASTEGRQPFALPVSPYNARL
jgi:hypothetical protein